MPIDEIIVRYGATVDQSSFQAVGTEVKKVNNLLTESEQAFKAAYSGKTLEEATKDLLKYGTAVDEIVEQYGSVGRAIKATKQDLERLYVTNKKDSDLYKAKEAILKNLTKAQQDFNKETKKAFSDTRLFNTLVEGARGVTAAFSVATSVSALFGKENEDLQKSILKVQAATGILTGFQEAANIVTEKGGIATALYGSTLTVVEGIAKRFGISMAASWALATAGITVVLGLIATLIITLYNTDDASGELTETQKELNKELKKEVQVLEDLQIEYDKTTGKITELEAAQAKNALDSNRRIEEIQKGIEENAAKGSKTILSTLLFSIGMQQTSLNMSAKKYQELLTQGTKESAELIAAIREEQRIRDAEAQAIADKKAQDDAEKAEKERARKRKEAAQKEAEFLKYLRSGDRFDQAAFEKEAKEQQDAIDKANQIEFDKERDAAIAIDGIYANRSKRTELLIDYEVKLMNRKLEAVKAGSKQEEQIRQETADKIAAINKAAAAAAIAEQKMVKSETIRLQTTIVDSAQKSVASIGTLIASILSAQVTAIQQQAEYANKKLEESKERALQGAGDNAQKRAAIERRFDAQREKQEKDSALKSAKIKREQAVFEKAFGLANVAIELAQAIQKIQLSAAVLLSNPLTAALAPLAFAQIPFAVATSALQAATIAATPLPPLPKFEKGGEVLAGGAKRDGHLYGRSHRQGGMLIEAQGGEYIWDIPSVQRHGDIIKAAHENRLEAMIFHKYVVPALQNKQQQTQSEYDDFMLRTETKGVRKAVNESTKHIVRAIKDGNNGYVNSRYHG